MNSSHSHFPIVSEINFLHNVYYFRYVNTEGSINEDFVDFMECEEGTTGEGVAHKIKTTLQVGYGLDLQNLRGQGYDGAGNMAGKTKGAAALITADYPLALYLHCASHCLNLAIVKSTNITSKLSCCR